MKYWIPKNEPGTIFNTLEDAKSKGFTKDDLVEFIPAPATWVKPTLIMLAVVWTCLMITKICIKYG